MSDQNRGIIEVELKTVTNGYRRVLKDTLAIFRDVTSYLNHVVADHYNELKSLNSKESLTAVEQLIHKTKENPNPEYKTFDTIFYKLPCYIRRAAVHAAVGHISSHETRCDQYYEKREEEIKRGHHYTKMESGFTYTPNSCPTLYRSQTFKMDLARRVVFIKVFIRNTWDWIKIKIPKRDIKSLQKAMLHGKIDCPKLIYKYHKFYLQFPVKYRVHEFPDTPLEGRVALGVDLGLNTGATVSAVGFCGTVHHRAFSPFDKDMDRILHTINLIRKYQSLSGKGQSLSKLYTKLKGLKENYVKQLSRWIVNQAIITGSYGIVLEHLNSLHRGKRPKGLRQKVHHWCVAKIRDYVKGMALREGIRVFIVNPSGTSQYAYDGSGKVLRGKDAGFSSYALCQFSSGKIYNCDLNASYNIASRYFLRTIQKSISSDEWSELVAKVPGLSRRIEWALATLVQTAVVFNP